MLEPDEAVERLMDVIRDVADGNIPDEEARTEMMRISAGKVSRSAEPRRAGHPRHGAAQPGRLQDGQRRSGGDAPSQHTGSPRQGGLGSLSDASQHAFAPLLESSKKGLTGIYSRENRNQQTWRIGEKPMIGQVKRVASELGIEGLP